MDASALPLLTTLSEPTLSPDGRFAVIATSRADLDADAYVGQLWVVPRDGSAPARRLTRGRLDSAPRYSPDGALVAFLRSPAADSAPQLHVVDARGGEPVVMTDAPLGVGEFVWSPTGDRIAYVARVPEHGRYGSVDGLEPNAEPPRRFTTLGTSANGVGYIVDRRAHVFVAAVPDVGAEPEVRPYPRAEERGVAPSEADARPRTETTQVTWGPYDHSSPAFSPDGSLIAVVAARHPGRDDDRRAGVYVFEAAASAEGAAAVEPVHATLAAPDLSVASVTWFPSGELVLAAQDLGPTGRDFVGRIATAYRVEPTAGGGWGAVARLLDGETLDLTDDARLLPGSGGSVLAQRRSRGRSELVAVSSAGAVTSLYGGDVEVHGIAVAPLADDSDAIVAVIAGPASVGTLVDVASGRALTTFETAVGAAGLVTPTEFETPSDDGYPVHGWIAVPEGEGPHPVLLNIHGGPYSQYTVSLFDETQVYVDAGYAVVYCNPRGSASYGEAHGRAIRGAMGTLDQDDVLAFLDGAIASDPRLDGDRVGILGGSYGGFLTAWTIAHDHRFAGAIVERGFLDPDGFVGTSDIGNFFGDEYVGTDEERMRAQSPQAVAGQVRTPTLVMHSEKDLRCPLGQAERYYTALKRAGHVETELLVFPGENHELSRSGRPRHRQQRFEAILEWWARYLPTAQNSAG